ncbi:glycosyltransferase [Rhizobium sp. 16-449-1b]|uniref:glycosyltransferase n=1 Tax=Rhizobium sp. 16-449-1b TaxID=2819989 RepID=UPI000648D06C|nr:glycosyltransferase [Rhizobium sp. 16-449-1b]MBO9196853.1 glycosyltransferase [Rhizobium sp. 16-449-1b]
MATPSHFTINGRFLTQNTTGVQRYAANVVKAVDAALGEAGASASIATPANAPLPNLEHTTWIRRGAVSGHAWEQAILPLISEGRLLNLCNTAPVARDDQIVCIHDANIFSSPESYTLLFRTLYHTLHPQLVKRSARIATVSHAAARQLARHLPIRAQDIAILPNGHEHALSWNPALAKAAPSFLNDIAGHGERPFVLAIGSRATHKNLGLLVAIAEQLDELGIDLVFAGGGGDIFAAGELDERRNVYRLGRVSDDDLAYLLDRALCLAFPSLTEGFGLPIVEAMARGCPVISANCASMPEVCGDAALLASPFDGEAWVHHIKALQTSDGLASELVDRGREQVKMFSWAETAKGYMELLEQPSSILPTYAAKDFSTRKIAVACATRGRPHIVSQTIKHLLATQTHKPDAVIVSCADLADAGELASHPDVTVLVGPPGSSAQRNKALAHLKSSVDVIAFFDDDFVADENWLAAAVKAFSDESHVVGFTGEVIADGIKGPGIPFEEALMTVKSSAKPPLSWIERYSPYGCNMAFRTSAIGETTFDERLVLYGWLEDRDFGATLARNGGRLVKSSEAYGVHMGVKGGRVNGERLGYSQVINPLYMLRKRTMTASQVAGQIFRNMASNFGRAAQPEPFIDRRGRIRGNLMGIADVLRGRLQPERAAELSIARKLAPIDRS